MALETIRNVLGQMALRGFQERSESGRASLLGQRLQNELAARQLDELFPLQVEKLQREIATILDPEQAFLQEAGKQSLIAAREKAVADWRNELAMKLEEYRKGPMSSQRFAQETAIRRASIGPRNVQTEKLLLGPDGKPSTEPHMWALNPDGTPANYIGPAPKSASAEQRTSATALKEMYQTQVGRVDAKGVVVEEPSNELLEVRKAVEGTRKGKLLGVNVPGTSEPITNAPEFFQRLVSSGFPTAPEYRKLGTPQAIRAKYPSLTQAVEQWREAVAQGPTEMSLEMSAPAEEVIVGDQTYRKNPDGSYTRIK